MIITSLDLVPFLTKLKSVLTENVKTLNIIGADVIKLVFFPFFVK